MDEASIYQDNITEEGSQGVTKCTVFEYYSYAPLI